MAQTLMCTASPQVKDLPHDLMIGVTCTGCRKGWGESVRGLMERRLGAQFLDLLEWQTRCDCGAAVEFAYAGKPVAQRPAVVAAARPKLPAVTPWPVKAVVKRRVYAPAPQQVQMNLPFGLPAMGRGALTGQNAGAKLSA